MDKNNFTPETYNKLVEAQKNEITEASIYFELAKRTKDSHNRETLTKIANQEIIHAKIWQSYTGLSFEEGSVRPNRFKIWFYLLSARIMGLTFSIKLMEERERKSVIDYQNLSQVIPCALQIQKEEEEHESQLIAIVKDKSLDYLGSIVLGLNDALVELTGILAGLTFGLQNAKLIASVGIITGISAAFSMAASEYLSTKTDDSEVKPKTAAVYTGIAYICTVVALIIPFLLTNNLFIALGLTLVTAILIIAAFNYYTSIAKGYSFKARFLEMVAISMGVALISFVIGAIVKLIFNIEV